jgi:hypothetical protein
MRGPVPSEQKPDPTKEIVRKEKPKVSIKKAIKLKGKE